MQCNDAQPLLACYADGEVPAGTLRQLEAHLASCAACRLEADIQVTMRKAIAAGARPSPEVAPPWLRTRIAAQLAAERAVPASVPPDWRTRLSAFAAAAMVVMAVGAVTIPLVTGRSTVVLAAQLALDHLKCFTIDGDAHASTLSVADAESELRLDYGWDLPVPATAGAADARLVAVRRCLYGDGRAAHLLYRLGDEPVSLFILPGLERPAESLSLMGQDEVVWTASGRTYMLVAAHGLRPRLVQMASNLRNEAQ